MATAQVKREPGQDPDPDPEFMKERIAALCRDHPKGITIDLIKDHVPLTVSNADSHYVMALNALLKAGQMKVFKKKVHGKDTLLYRLIDAATASTSSAAMATGVTGVDVEERIVYQVIEAAGNKGIWLRDIRKKTNMSIQQLQKLLKVMTSKKLVKEVKCVNASKKKVYMLFDLIPDSSVTGGAWYSDNTFDQEFADIINECCFRYLDEKSIAAKARFSEEDPYSQHLASLVTAEEVQHHINNAKVTKNPMDLNDVVMVLNTVVYDGKAAKVDRVSGASEGNDKLYYRVAPIIKKTGLMSVPCGFCPMIDECTNDGPISPRTCVHMKEWLDKLDW
ncbi:hypothetical protein ACOMHN_019621 [Nucella lapillus]